jgi:hypothetical protein
MSIPFLFSKQPAKARFARRLRILLSFYIAHGGKAHHWPADARNVRCHDYLIDIFIGGLCVQMAMRQRLRNGSAKLLMKSKSAFLNNRVFARSCFIGISCRKYAFNMRRQALNSGKQLFAIHFGHDEFGHNYMGTISGKNRIVTLSRTIKGANGVESFRTKAVAKQNEHKWRIID